MPPAAQGNICGRVARLRAEMARLGLDGVVIPHADEYQNEVLPSANERLAHITGFTGSAGVAVVLRDKALLLVDGRYILAAPTQTDTALFSVMEAPPASLVGWVREAMPQGGKLGFDPWTHAHDWATQTRQALTPAGIALVALEENLVDKVWEDRPPLPTGPAVPHPAVFAGEGSATKRQRLAEQLKKDNLDGFVITDPASLAWLLNLRGGDMEEVPIALGFGVLYADETVDLFMDLQKCGQEVRAHMGAGVRLHTREDFVPFLSRQALQRKLGADMGHASEGVSVATDGRLTAYPDPCLKGRAVKNEVELEGARRAHRRDGVALVRFFSWLAGQQQPVDELGVMEQLRMFRAEGEHFRGVSFETIAGSGPHGAIVHYRATAATNRAAQPGEFFLIDSGGQYLDATTDVTRTVAMGDVTPEMRTHFTRVLKGHIAVASSIFPEGTTGGQIDSFARRPLWQAGLDFSHGTGHGVGSYLTVHEGPAQICAPRPNRKGALVALEPGMILSNEPGYYKAGAYGIRIESLMAVVRCPLPGAEHPMLAFETLTLCPIDRTAIDVAMLTAEECAWLNAYHQRVRDALTPALGQREAQWLEKATAPL